MARLRKDGDYSMIHFSQGFLSGLICLSVFYRCWTIYIAKIKPENLEKRLKWAKQHGAGFEYLDGFSDGVEWVEQHKIFYRENN